MVKIIRINRGAIGAPFLLGEEDEGVIESVNVEDKTIYACVKKSDIYYRKLFNTKNKKFVFFPALLGSYDIYGTILDIKDSSSVFGMKQIKKGFMHSTLRVVNMELNEDGVSSITLQTGRKDKTSLKMVATDVLISFPTMLSEQYLKPKKEIIIGDVVIVKRDSKTDRLSKGEKYVVRNIFKNESDPQLDVVELEDGVVSKFSYRTNLKQY